MKVAWWILDRFPTLISLVFAIIATVRHETAIALGFYVMAIVGEVSRQQYEMRRELDELRRKIEAAS